MTFSQVIQTSKIYSIAGLLSSTPLIVHRPFRILILALMFFHFVYRTLGVSLANRVVSRIGLGLPLLKFPAVYLLTPSPAIYS